MMDQSPRHLSDDDLLKTLVDLDDLDPARSAHLASCSQCLQQAQALTLHYQHLGQLARNAAPGPARRFRLPSQESARPLWWLKPVAALAVIGAVIFTVTIWTNRMNTGVKSPPGPMARIHESDRQLMREVDALVKDALPVPYQYVAVVSEPILTRDLIDWIVPSIDEDDTGKNPKA